MLKIMTLCKVYWMSANDLCAFYCLSYKNEERKTALADRFSQLNINVAFYNNKTHMTNTWVCDKIHIFRIFPLFRHYLTLKAKTLKVG